MQTVYGPGAAASGLYVDYTPPAGDMSAPQPQPYMPSAGSMDGDNSYIHRSMSGVTVGGDGNGNFYVNDSGSGSSVANDGY